MKVFAILTACLMAAGGATYYLTSSDGTCPLTGCPVAKTGGCCATGDASKVDGCAEPCPACSTDCRECCDVCEACCVAGVSVPAVKTSAKADCCSALEACCEKATTCCGDKAATPASIATSAAVAGVTLK